MIIIYYNAFQYNTHNNQLSVVNLNCYRRPIVMFISISLWYHETIARVKSLQLRALI